MSLESTLLWLFPEHILDTVKAHKQDTLPVLFLGHPVVSLLTFELSTILRIKKRASSRMALNHQCCGEFSCALQR